MFKRYFRDKKGLTLLECVFAIGLSLLIFISFFTAIILVNQWIRDSTHHLVSIYLCREKIEEYREMDYENIPLGSFSESVTIDEGSDLDSADDNLTGRRKTVIVGWDIDGDSIPNEGKKITANVSWTNSRGQQHNQMLMIGIANPE